MLSSKSGIKLLALVCCLTAACHRVEEPSPLVARVYDHELRMDDLAGLVGDGVSAEDSAAIVDNYVDQWVRQTVMLAKAEKNVKDDFSRQMNEYRNSLLTYAYERQIVEQLLDTMVTDAQIAEYYDGHSGQFLLKNSIVKAVYVAVPLKNNVDGKLRGLVYKRDFDEEDVVEMQALATRAGGTGSYDADVWHPFYSLQNAVPITTYNENLYLKQNRSIVLADDSLRWYLRILDYKITDDISPLELQRDNIRAIILNHRKLDILSRLQADLLKEAEDGGHVERIKVNKK